MQTIRMAKLGAAVLVAALFGAAFGIDTEAPPDGPTQVIPNFEREHVGKAISVTGFTYNISADTGTSVVCSTSPTMAYVQQ